MKKILLTAVAVSIMFQAKAQLFSPESITGAALGAIAGGVIGHNSGRHGGEGAAIGAGIGLLAGSLVHNSRERHGHYSHYPSGYYSSPGRGYVNVGFSTGHYGYSHHGHHHHRHGYWGPSFGFGYSYHRPIYYSRPAYVAPVVTTPVYVQQPAPVAVQQPTPAPAPQQVTIINNYYGSGTPMSSANAMFGR